MFEAYVGQIGYYRRPYQPETSSVVERVIHMQTAMGAGRAFFLMANGDRVAVDQVFFMCGEQS